MPRPKLGRLSATERIKALAGIILSHAATAENERVAHEKIKETFSYNPIETEKALAGMLLDGLAYDNWPWVLEGLRVQGL